MIYTEQFNSELNVDFIRLSINKYLFSGKTNDFHILQSNEIIWVWKNKKEKTL